MKKENIYLSAIALELMQAGTSAQWIMEETLWNC